MKKLIILLLVVFSMTSCYEDLTNNVENPKKFTTLEMQDLKKDTVVISIDKSRLYVFNDSCEVVMRARNIGSHSFSVNGVYVFFLHLFSVFFFVLLIGVFKNKI